MSSQIVNITLLFNGFKITIFLPPFIVRAGYPVYLSFVSKGLCPKGEKK